MIDRMFRGSAAGRARIAGAALVLWAGVASAADLRLAIDSPADGSVVRAAPGTLSVRGSVRVEEFTPAPTDVVLLIDASEDAAGPSGADVDGDGRANPGGGIRISRWGVPVFRIRKSGDSILAAEVLSGRRIAETWSGPGARIGIVVIASPYDPHPCEHGPKGPGAKIILPLTPDRDLVFRALDGVLDEGPRGASNLAEGIRLAASMLAGLPGTASAPRPGVQRLIVFLGYRAPTFPFGSPFHTAPEDLRLAENAARAAASAGIGMEGFSFGPAEGKVLGGLGSILAAAGGHLTPVADPRQAGFDVGTVTAGVVVSGENETRREGAARVILAPDGTWTAVVPVTRGENRIRMRARAGDGTQTSRTLVIRAE